jgi:hypothetical protein
MQAWAFGDTRSEDWKDIVLGTWANGLLASRTDTGILAARTKFTTL